MFSSSTQQVYQVESQQGKGSVPITGLLAQTYYGQTDGKSSLMRMVMATTLSTIVSFAAPSLPGDASIYSALFSRCVPRKCLSPLFSIVDLFVFSFHWI
jgi:hypothetical protein